MSIILRTSFCRIKIVKKEGSCVAIAENATEHHVVDIFNFNAVCEF